MTVEEKSIQDLQLELIRRASFNAFDGERVRRDLVERRALWRAVLMDRPGPPRDLIKLRDLPDGHWNVDTLCVLARDEPSARLLADLGEPWAADSVVVYGERATQESLGTSKDLAERLVTFWWD